MFYNLLFSIEFNILKLENNFIIILNLGFYGRPWVMEQRKELFRR